MSEFTPLGAIVTTQDGSLTLSHPGHGECYHSDQGAAREARELYVEASGIDGRWSGKDPVRVLDVGLGLAYNAVATIAAWQRAANPPDLVVQSLEIDDALVLALASGQAPWQSNWPDRELMIVQALRRAPDGGWRGTSHHPRAGAVCDWVVQLGDARTEAVTPFDAPWDFVWQDPFSPQKNPDMWSAAWFRKVRAGAAPGCTLMTYSVARAVRDALAEAGWTYEKIPTTGVKKHWLRAQCHLNVTSATAEHTTK